MFQKKRLDGMWASETMDGQTKSLGGNIYSQLFYNGTFFDEIYPMARKSDTRIALKTFITDLGVYECLTIDFSKDQNAPGTEFMKSLRRNDIQVTRIEPEQLNQNPSEGVIEEVQQRWFCTMIRQRLPQRL